MVFSVYSPEKRTLYTRSILTLNNYNLGSDYHLIAGIQPVVKKPYNKQWKVRKALQIP
jgi:hypothetical protein